MTIAGPVFLRWREGVSPAPAIEEFDSLDAALDAIEERWEKLQHQAPQILDRRRVLVVNTEDLRRMMESE